jgi:hypothetical protein
MTGRILLIGDDPTLLATRALLLSDLKTMTANSIEAALVMNSQPFDLIIIGQLVTYERVVQLIEFANGLRPEPAVLVVRFPGELNGFPAEIHSTAEMHDPGWFKEHVKEVLFERATGPRSN